MSTPVKKDKPKLDITGNRIVDILHLFSEFQKVSSHCERFGCTLNNMELINENRDGLMSKFVLKCNMCCDHFIISTTKQDGTLNLNDRAVSGIMSIGGGFYNLEEFLSSLDIPCMSSKAYRKSHGSVSSGWEEAALEKMRLAATEEANHAKSIGAVDSEGYPLVTVIVDGCWSKRSYKTNYNALSGVAAIVGQHTKKILYYGVRNKFCTFCSRAALRNEEPREHVCGKNHKGSSSSMESNILVEGFKRSVEMYGIKYAKMIADGDSSTYKKILEARPYQNLTVEKIECRNHLLRNYCNKLKALTKESGYPMEYRKLLDGRIMRLRTAIIGT